jgi:O-6-methylguanine DNA methyltransferase
MNAMSRKELRETYNTPFGPGLLVWRGGLLVAHRLPRTWRESSAGQGMRDSGVSAAGGSNADRKASARAAADLTRLLESYFAGNPVDFKALELPLDSSHWTDFQQAVAAALAAVPHGSTATYGELAARAGYPRAYRAVGSFMARNSFPVILPCHRVIRSEGKLGNFASGVAWKTRLLGMEGISL